jgi:hypothetical protein
VLETGKTFTGKAIPADSVASSVLEHRYIDISYTRIVDADNTPSIMHMSVDVTEQVLAQNKIEENKADLEGALE